MARRSPFAGPFAAFLALLVVGCSSHSDNAGSVMERELTQRKLLRISVQPQELVMANRPAPVPLIKSPCNSPVFQGIERYADVGWVAPVFFVVSTPERKLGYALTPLPANRMRFTARFRFPQSEDEAVELWGDRERGAEPILFCNVPATLRSLKDSGIKRLAAWPTDSIKAFLQLPKPVELVLDLRDWQQAQEVNASAVLDPSDAAVLQQYLRSPLGASIQFDSYSRLRRFGCVQVIALYASK